MLEMRDMKVMREQNTMTTDRTDTDLFRPKNILQFSLAGEQAQVEEAVPSSVVPEHMLQYVSFKLDKAYPERWVKDH